MATTDVADFLLLDEFIGERLTRGERYKKIAVSKGALLKGPIKPVSRSSPSHTFSVIKAGKPRTNTKYTGTTIRIPGGRESSKIALLSKVEYRLMKGVAGDSARYEVYTSGRLKIKSGEEVFVKLANVSEPIAAVLRWRGVVYRGIGLPGFHRFGDKELKFGIEIADTRYYGHGDSNGRLNGVNYFLCDDNCGGFVSWDKLFLPSSFDEVSDTQSTDHGCITPGMKWAVSAETLSSCVSMDDNDESLLIPAQHIEGHNKSVEKSPNENRYTILEGRKDFRVTEINISTGFEREWWEIPRKNIRVSSVVLKRDEWGYVTQGALCGQKVAVKSFHQDIVAQLVSDQVQQEMQMMAQVHHPNFLLFIGAILDPVAGPLIVTELLDQTLQSAYEDQLLKEHSKLPILRDVASALNYLHSHCPPIVHGGINSSNVLLEALRNGRWKAKLSDFGMVNLIHAHIFNKALKQETCAKDEYSAPEIQTGTQSWTQIQKSGKIDVYSFGILFCKISFNSRVPSDCLSGSSQGDVDPKIFQSAENCTRLLPHERPTMNEVLVQIDEALLIS